LLPERLLMALLLPSSLPSALLSALMRLLMALLLPSALPWALLSALMLPERLLMEPLPSAATAAAIDVPPLAALPIASWHYRSCNIQSRSYPWNPST
jgi:hypothetical protein